MTIINWILLNAGYAALWLGHAIAVVFGTVFGALDALLNPVLARIVAVVNVAGTWVGDIVYAVLRPLPVWAGLTILSAVCGVLMLFAYKLLSNQAAIGRSRDRMTAQMLALKLFKDDIGVAFRTQGRLGGALLKWQWYMLRPMVLLVILLLPVFAQMGTRYQWRPLHPGEQTLITLRVRPDAKLSEADLAGASLEPTRGLADILGPVPGGGALVWRARGGLPGRYTLTFNVGGETVEKDLVVGSGLHKVSAERPSWHWTAQILHPLEWPLPGDGPVERIEIGYPGVQSYIYGANWWILYFFIVSMGVAILLLPFVKVRF